MNSLTSDTAVFIQVPKGRESERTKAQRGDVLLTITGSRIGRVAPVPSDVGAAYVSQHVAILRPTDELLPDYLSVFLSLRRGGQFQIARCQYGQTKPGLNLEQIRNFQVAIPTVENQRRFACIVSKHRSLRDLVAARVKEAAALVKSLQYSFFGTVGTAIGPKH